MFVVNRTALRVTNTKLILQIPDSYYQILPGALKRAHSTLMQLFKVEKRYHTLSSPR